VESRFFLNTYRVLSDGWGVFAYDTDAGFARGFVPDGQPFRFHGWRNGVMVMKSKDGTLCSRLTGIAFDGPRKGNRLQPDPTLLSDWGFWLSCTGLSWSVFRVKFAAGSPTFGVAAARAVIRLTARTAAVARRKCGVELSRG
jgi:hypothetical protein